MEYLPTDKYQNWFITSLQTDVNDTTASFRLNKALNVQQGRLVIDPYDESNREIVKVTSVDGTLVYVERGDDHTSPAYHNEGAIVVMEVFAADLNDLYADWALMQVDLQEAADDANAAAAAANAILDDASAATLAANAAAGSATSAASSATTATTNANAATTNANAATTAANTAAGNASSAATAANSAAVTAEDAAEEALAAAGHFVPAGGLAGQALIKKTNGDWDTEWGSGGGVFIKPKEAVTGTIDGTNRTFTTLQPYVAGTLQVYVNGWAQSFYIEETNPATGQFRLDVAPEATDDVKAYYHYAATQQGDAASVQGYTVTGLLQAIFPVGSTFTSNSSTMPALIASIGTWTRLKGRFIIGLDEADADFDTLNETGGVKNHIHKGYGDGDGLGNGDMRATVGSGSGQADSLNFQALDPINPNTGGGMGNGTYNVGGTNRGSMGFSHFTKVVGYTSRSSNLPPYKVKYVWERTA